MVLPTTVGISARLRAITINAVPQSLFRAFFARTGGLPGGHFYFVEELLDRFRTEHYLPAHGDIRDQASPHIPIQRINVNAEFGGGFFGGEQEHTIYYSPSGENGES